MRPVGIIPVATVGLLAALWKAHEHGASKSKVQRGLWIAWLCWAFIFVLCRVRSWSRSQPYFGLQHQEAQIRGKPGSRNTKKYILVTAIAAAQTAQSLGALDLVSPFVTIAVYFAVKSTSERVNARGTLEELQDLNGRESQNLKHDQSDKPISWIRPLGFVAASVVSSIFLALPVNRAVLLLTVVCTSLFFLGQTAVYILLPRMRKIYDEDSLEASIIIDWDLLEGISLLSFAVYTFFLAIAVPNIFVPDLNIILSAVVEATRWLAVISLGMSGLPIIPTTFDTFAASIEQSIHHPQFLNALLVALPALTALWQTVSTIPPAVRHRQWLYVLLLLSSLGRLTQEKHNFLEKPGSGPISSGLHPIEDFVAEAQVRFTGMLKRQSTTLDQATKEYRERYGRKPPPHFDRWFDLALHNGFALVDEFDVMMQSLAPFWGVPPSTLQAQCDRALAQSPQYLLKYELHDHRVTTSHGDRASWFSAPVTAWLQEDWLELLPNMRLAINVYDEPSVCVPRDTLDAAMRIAGAGAAPQHPVHRQLERDVDQSPRFLNLGAQDAWEAITLSCPVDSAARSADCTVSINPDALPFIRNLTQSKNLCDHCELQDSEGFLITPDTLHLTHSLVPIWSQSKPSSFNDIIYPSPYYTTRSGDYVEGEDRDWNLKDNQLYWVGAATGGHTTKGNWDHMQRQRFVLMSKSSSTEPIRLLKEPTPGNWVTYATNMSEVSSLFSSRVIGVTPQCEPEACNAQKAAFAIGETEVKDPAHEAYMHKFLLDMDGNSFSGRFYRLLQSKSMVLKQAVFKEWHDDRVIPWVHFVPVSTSFQELPETMRFLATTEKGQEISRTIATESREWAGKALRVIDFKLVWLRLLMEYGRIMNPDRDSLNCCS